MTAAREDLMARLSSFEGLNTLVTGASSGIGRLLALRLGRAGARVALVARRRAVLEDVAGEISSSGGYALVVPCDVGEPAQVLAAAERAVDALGPIELLVNNAGYGRRRRFLDWELADMERMFRVNFLGALGFTRALTPGMAAAGRGWVVFISSVAGRIATPGESAYSASKFAMTGLASALSLEVEDAGVHVLTVYPGAIRTPFFDGEALARMPAAARRWMAEPGPLVDAIFAALRAGRRELTFPRWMAVAYAVQALLPGAFLRQLKRSTLPALRSAIR
jgi:short-subunit dehydrogenase